MQQLQQPTKEQELQEGLMAINQQIAKYQQQYAGKYMSLAFNAVLKAYGERGMDIEQALTEGFELAEQYRAKETAYEQKLLSEADVPQGLAEAQQEIILQLKQLEQGKSKVIPGPGAA